ncbi:MAG TPA: trypsin-like peptidase domain-containing protein [Longimicrobiales bacterium]
MAMRLGRTGRLGVALLATSLGAAPLGGCGNAGAPARTEDAGRARAAFEFPQLRRPADDDSLAAAQAELDASRRTAIVRAAERVAPAVVSVNVIRREVVRPRTLWESFFVPPGAREVAGLGSGFIIREDGLILTNEHVVRGADRVVVTLPDGRQFDAEVVGTDEMSDLAVVRITGPVGSEGTKASGLPPLPVAPLGDSDDLMIGEWVVAIGNPLGFVLSNTEPTVTAGVISGVGRNIMPGGEDERGYYLDMIQTDASINPGNSGGPLVNALGEVIGVNSSIISRSGGSEGLGFAIPIDRARRIAFDLLDDGQVRRAWVGLEPEQAGNGRLGRAGAVRVSQVAEGSPAAEAGVRPGWVLRRAGDEAIRTALDWESVLLDAVVGQPIELVFDDGDGRERVVRVTPADLPSVTAERIRALADFELVTLTPAIRAERGLVSERGALIVSASPVARQIGLREGDLIVQVNRVPVESAEEAARLLQRLAGEGPVRVFFERQGRLGSVYFYING